MQVRLKLQVHELMRWCRDMADGMAFIAAGRIVHMDLASRNILLGKGNVLKIADFGLAQRIAEGETSWELKAKMRLPMRWQSPEAMTTLRFSEASDVWAYGVTCWEFFNGAALPYNTTKLVNVKRSVVGGMKLTPPDDAPDTFRAALKRVWHSDPKKRPTFVELRQMASTGFDQCVARLPADFEQRDVGAVLESKKQ